MAFPNAVPPTPMVPLSPDEAVSVLQQAVTEHAGRNEFSVKVFRKIQISASPSHIASFEGATVEHLVNPELWLPKLAGSGPIFVLAVRHASEQIALCTIQPAMMVGQQHEVDPAVVDSPDWRGPPAITYPTAADRAAQDQRGAMSALSRLSGVPGSAGDPTSRGQRSPPSGDAGHSDARIALVEAQYRLELASLAKSIESQTRATERQIATLMDTVKLATSAPREPQKSIMDQIPALVAAAAPFVTAILSRSESEAKARRESDARREAREAEQRAEMTKLLLDMSNRASSASGDMAKILSPMVEVTSQMSRTMLQQVATMRELSSPGEPQESMTTVIKAGIEALGEVMAARATAGVQPPALGPKSPAPPAAPESKSPHQNLAEMDPADLLGRIEAAIRAHHEPVELASAFREAVAQNKGVAESVTEAGGPLKFFRARLTDAWIASAEHAPYIAQLVKALSAAPAAG